MKLYLISQDKNNNYDTYDSAVVVANSEEEARNINPGTEGWGDKYSTWCASPKDVKVEYLGEAAGKYDKPEVILGSFNAG